MDIRERLSLQYNDEEFLFADGFDDAIVGVSFGLERRIVYDARLMAAKLVREEKLDYSQAWEYLEYNTFQAYVGNKTPIYVNLERTESQLIY